jgi:hypothetical protein
VRGVQYRGKGKKTLAKEDALRREMQEIVLTVKPKELVNFRCKCNRSKCLKMYCECFTSGYFCGDDCNCVGCANTEENQHQVREARVFIKKRNQNAFKEKVAAVAAVEPVATEADNSKGEGSKPKVAAVQLLGCTCRKSNCLKGYCECYHMGLPCIPGKCKCVSCLNTHVRESAVKLTEKLAHERDRPEEKSH